MPDDDDDSLRLNTLSRLHKSSPRLLLEEYSHCEVPAGCGGVVLRWRDPRASASAVLWLWSPGNRRVWLDGAELESTRLQVPWGPRVLALEIAGLPAAGGLLALALVPEIRGADADADLPAPLLVSAPAAEFERALTTPLPGWQAPGAPAAGWVRATTRPLPQPGRDDPEAWQVTRLLAHRAEGLVLPPGPERAWLRCRFQNPGPPGEGPPRA